MFIELTEFFSRSTDLYALDTIEKITELSLETEVEGEFIEAVKIFFKDETEEIFDIRYCELFAELGPKYIINYH